ncbi:MAG: aminoacyl-tRNA hydrolase [Bifidobacteriaceae bacterium]|jgi:PTH1 family peptidyl-tRNA hydrolase|nr:aminoacyl-tRNA hydrolase [Bifidobacteriaceae bacterium]
MSSDVHLIVGLGNAGPEYVATRHNLGFMVVDHLAAQAGTGFKPQASLYAQVSALRLGMLPGGVPGPRVILAKSLGFMNESGGPVAAVADYYGIDTERIVIVHDDLDLPFGDVRLKLGGGTGGHNGLKSIQRALGGPGFLRVRCGIGRPPGRMNPADYVLHGVTAANRPALDQEVARAADAVTLLVQQGLAAAQLKYHTKPESVRPKLPRDHRPPKNGAGNRSNNKKADDAGPRRPADAADAEPRPGMEPTE